METRTELEYELDKHGFKLILEKDFAGNGKQVTDYFACDGKSFAWIGRYGINEGRDWGGMWIEFSDWFKLEMILE